ncbi:uncharacterized protein LOC126324754 isoform X2 [Schistocerca gregaria]|uniref:uncharacterized protein LOC126324754 isoform X2 n=1 Tax=Schistocerca gregaria TaxID=7010 RepID=UPI00211E8C81|nr:uncharacterized protein LOC126324754 isoform X2 [Schistocerca gregaria]
MSFSSYASSERDEIQKYLEAPLKWKRYGVFLWSTAVFLPFVCFVSAAYLLAIPFIFIRIALINASIYTSLGFTIRRKVGLFFIDITVFFLVFISPEFIKSKILWAFISASLYHLYSRAYYHLNFTTVIQRRLARIRLAFPLSIRSSIQMLKCLLSLLAILFLIRMSIPLWLPVFSGSGDLKKYYTLHYQRAEEEHLADSLGLPNSDHVSTSDFRYQYQQDRDHVFLQIFKNPLFTLIYTLINPRDLSISLVLGRLVDISSTVIILEMVWHIASIVHTEHLSFDQLLPIDLHSSRTTCTTRSSKAANRHALLLNALSTKNSFIFLHAYQDLYHLAYHQQERRQLFYSDLTCTSWQTFVNTCCSYINTVSDEIFQTCEYLDQGEQPTAAYSFVLSTIPVFIYKILGTIVKHLPRRDPTYFESLCFVVPSHSLALQQTTLLFCIGSIAKLTSTSFKEDGLGLVVANNTIPVVLNSLLTLLQETETYVQKMIHVFGSPTHLSFNSCILGDPLTPDKFCHTLISAITEAIYEITTVFYEYLKCYSFSPAQARLLKEFLDFTR